MIPRPKPSPSHLRAGTAPPVAVPLAAVPSWLRKAIPGTKTLAAQGFGPNAVEDVAIAAGAAIGTLDTVVRRNEKWAGAWRQRLALTAAAITAKQVGRVEDEAALRDAVLLTRPGDAVGPAGSLLLAWRRLAARPAGDLLIEASLVALCEELGMAGGNEAGGDLARDLRQLFMRGEPVEMLTGAYAGAERHGFGRSLSPWLADALLAQRMGWSHAVPVLGTRPPTTGRMERAPVERVERVHSLLMAQARAALRAIDLSAELGRRSERLIAIAPKLRAKAADMVVEKLLADDAIVASQDIPGMSDRGLRRLFERLVDLGAVRELSGRPTFRIYGI